jgi:predicted DNA-binding protein (MmcQ/YjbR family)
LSYCEFAAYLDYPFDDGVTGEIATATLRHRANKKIFALIMRRGSELYLNLKCDPLEADFLRQAFKGIIPGWHMNHQHWNTVIVGTDVPEEELKRQIGNSYDLIKPKVREKILLR